MENLPINLYGESIFTSFRSWESNIPGLNLHIERLAKSLNHYFFNNLEDLDKIKSIISKKINLHVKDNTYYRITVYLSERASFICHEVGLEDLIFHLSEKKLDSEINLVSKKLCLAPSPFTPNYIPIKSNNYLQHLLALKKARKNDYDDVLFHYQGMMTECTTSAVVFMKNSQGVTPKSSINLDSITLKLFNEFLEDSVSLREMNIGEISQYKYCFSLNSVQGISIIESIDDIKFDRDEAFKIAKQFISFLKVRGE